MKNSTIHHSLVLPLLAAGILAGVAEAASSGVRIHRIGDPPMMPRNLILVGPQQMLEPAAPVSAPKPAPRATTGATAHAVPMAPVGQEVGSAPVMTPPPAPRVVNGEQVPLAPVRRAPRPAMNYNQHIVAPEPAPAPEVIAVPEADIPLAPTRYVEGTVPPPASQARRSRLPLSPVGYVPATKYIATPAPAAAATPAPAAAKPQPRRRLPIAPTTL